MTPSVRRSLTVLAVPAVLAAAIAVTTLASSQTSGAAATPAPVVTGLSRTSVPFWGGNQVAVYGRNFSHVRGVSFGGDGDYGFQVVSPTKIVATYPEHAVGRVAVQVVTAAGTSRVTHFGIITYRNPALDDPINGGWSARQEQRVAARFMATARQRMSVPQVRPARLWNSAMGQSAVRRARAWLGMPYSFAGGNGRTPTRGVCSTSQGTAGALDCYVTGFDCSGLAMYAWGPYLPLPHFAATQFRVAGAHHPAPASLMPGDLLFFGSTAANIHHVAIYEGLGRVIQAPQSGRAVSETTLSDVLGWDYFGATRPRTIGAAPPAPVVTAVLTQVPTAGGWVEVAGRNFTDVASVSVNGRLAYDYRVRSSGRMAIKLPAHAAGRVSVAVSNAHGTSRAVTVVYAPPPAVGTIAPASGSTAGATTVTLRGSGFTGAYRVSFGTVAGTAVRVLSPTTLTVVAPAHSAGRVTLTVYSRYGTTVARPTYVYATPTPPVAPPAATPRAKVDTSTRR